MTERQLRNTAGTKMICAPRLGALSLPAHPATDEVTVDRVTIAPGVVRVEVTMIVLAAERVIGITSLHPNIEVLDRRNAGQENAGAPNGTIPIGDGRVFVFREAVTIKREPVAKLRNTVRKI